MGRADRQLRRARQRANRKREKKMLYKMRFNGWPGLRPGKEAPKSARVFVCLLQCFHLQPTDGAKNMGDDGDLETGLELTRLIKRLRDPETRTALRVEGGEYTVSHAAFEVIKANWKSVRQGLGADSAEDIAWMLEFLDPEKADDQCGITVIDPNAEKPQEAEANADTD
jgi:hypothetical protein